MTLYKLFTIQEATSLIPTVDGLLTEMQGVATDLAAVRARLGEVKPFSVEARNAEQEFHFLLTQLHQAKARLDELGVFVKDFETGVVEFPTQLHGEVVCLAWEKGQEQITHYHRFGEESAKPLPQARVERSAVGA